ncbi:MAG: EpsG family protein [Bacteroidaceae bacterium]|nr:EpsG family protein [Bacteroidaceae bacterium]
MYIALLFAILLVIAVLAFFEDEEIQNRGWLLLALATVLTLFVAFRPEGIDNDYNAYVGYFKSPTGVAASLAEPTFKLINGLARFFDASILLFVIYAFLAVPLKIYAIKRLSPYWYLSILLWFTHLFIIQEMTQIRVAVASGIFLFALPYLGDGKKLKFTLCMVAAILFHYSALALLPLVIFGNKELSRLFRCVLIVVPIIIYAFPFAGMDLLKLIPIPFIQQKLQMYEELMVYEGGVWADINIYNAMALVRLFAYYVLIWKYDYLKDKYPYMPILLKVFCYSICMYVGLSFLPPIAMRIEELIAIIDCIMFPLLAVLLRPHWLGRLLVVLYAVCILVANIFLYKLLKMY